MNTNEFARSPKLKEGFVHQVWDVVSKIPYGRVATYGQIAACLPPPDMMSAARYFAWGARMVGRAMAAAPEGIPWHRVVNAQGKISFRSQSCYQEQRQRLVAEGVQFDAHERIDLSIYGWNP